MAYRVDLNIVPIPPAPQPGMAGDEANLLRFQARMLLAIAERLEVIARDIRQSKA